MKTGWVILLAASILLITLIQSPIASPVSAEINSTFTVDASNDVVDSSPGDGICKTVNNSCTLRAAIMEANAHIGADTIVLPGATYNLTIIGAGEDFGATGDLDITESLTINGDSVTTTSIEADGLGDRVFEITSGAVNVSISNVVINRGTTSGDGGGLYNRGNVDLNGVNFNWNQAGGFGGAIYNSGNLEMFDGAVQVGIAFDKGGGIYTSGSLYVKDTLINGNQSSGQGGGLYVLNVSSVVIEGTTFSFNDSAGFGGNIFNTGQLYIRDSHIVLGTATAGGGIYNDSTGNIDLSRVNFTDNTATSNGGAISNAEGGFITGHDVLFDKNNTSGDGGAINNFKGEAQLTRAVFSNNSAWFGGAIFNNEGVFTLEKAIVENNTATNTGGGISSAGGVGGATMTLKYVTVSSNSAPSGAGIENGGELSAHDLVLADNIAGIQGGGLSNIGAADLYGCTIQNNRAENGGGVFNGDLLLATNCTVSGNHAVISGGGIYNLGEARLYSTTIAYNTARSSINPAGVGGGLYIGSGAVYQRNSILFGNTHRPILPVDDDCYGDVITQHYNLIGSLNGCNLVGDEGLDLIGADPLLGELVDNGGTTYTHALMEGSPAIDAANPNGCIGNMSIISTDQRGYMRPYDGDNDGVAICDIGAYEYPMALSFLPVLKK